MSKARELKGKILMGYVASKGDALRLIHEDLDTLCSCADDLRQHFCGNSFDICTIINGKSGRCPENCKYCAQSIHFNTRVEEYPLLSFDKIYDEARYNEEKGVLRYSIVTSGKRLSDAEVDIICETYKKLKENCTIALCASHGLLNLKNLEKLKKAGVTRYHNNLETSRRFFQSICTTHTYEEKINTIKAAKIAGLTVCSGGIFGLGETMEDRIDMALDLRNLEIKSIPINILNPIKGTPLENNKLVTEEEIRRTVAIYRFLIPDGNIRLAGGRGLLEDKGKSLFKAGVNAAITGDMLTTSGITIDEDLRLLEELEFKVEKIN